MADRNAAMRNGRVQIEPLGRWAGRLLLGAVVFWWGGVVIPHLISLVFPAWLPPDAIPRDLNPDIDLEGRLANRVSAAALLVLAVLAFVNAEVSRRRAAGWIAVSGWTVLAVAAAYLAWEEESEFHVASIALGVGRSMFSVVSQYLWVIILSPFIAAFVFVMVVFIYKGRHLKEVRVLLTLGILVWIFVLLQEASAPLLNVGRADRLGPLIEETLEFSGTLLIGLSAAINLRGRGLDVLRRRILVPLVVGSLASVALLGSLAGAFVFRTPLIEARLAPASGGGFYVALHDGMSAVQELRMPGSPIKELRIRLESKDSPDRAGIVTWRVIDGEVSPGSMPSGDFLREGRMEVSALERATWRSIAFDPPLSGVTGRRLGLQLVADVASGSHIRIAATKTNLYADGRLWVNGEPTWAGQNLEFVAYSAPEPTRSKLRALWQTLSSDWRWPVLLADLAIGLTLVTLIPALLVASVVLSMVPKRG